MGGGVDDVEIGAYQRKGKITKYSVVLFLDEC